MGDGVRIDSLGDVCSNSIDGSLDEDDVEVGFGPGVCCRMAPLHFGVDCCMRDTEGGRMKPVYHGSMRYGRFRPDLRERFMAASAALEGERVEVTLEKERKLRSLRQNSYYWGVVVKILADHCGYAPEEMHDAIKLRFLLVRGENGNPDYMKSTARQGTKEFEEYLENIRRWAVNDFNVVIPEPNQVEWTDNEL